MGVAHHGSYVEWFEEARTEWLRARGKTYRAFEDEGVFLQVVEVQVRYLRSVTYDDELEIETRLAVRKHASLTFEYEARLAGDGAVVARGATTLACVDRHGKLRRLPAEL
jgi:acyl-CoA thioester hydrolase